MTDTSGWVAIAREDRETVGYLEPVTDDYGIVQPRSLLGHAVGAPVDYDEGERVVEGLSLAELAEQWALDAGTADEVAGLTVIELSPHGILLADYYATKGLSVTEKVHVAWPDLQERLSRA
ncbi:hypothetical protein [Brachybacterium tyrofermentans]|uniref:hypothetical protein n=1 Tax=Brachybacterium tyrofermentans TaxID=47848 RepID=UPI003FD61408